MKNKREQEAIRAYFAQEPVPVEIHNALRQACQQLPPREESPAPAAGKAWRRLGGSLSTAAAAFVLLCCLNAVNPAFAESVPLLGEAFRLYNSQNKVAVGSYVGTYPQMEQPDAAAAAADAQGLSLIHILREEAAVRHESSHRLAALEAMLQEGDLEGLREYLA